VTIPTRHIADLDERIAAAFTDGTKSGVVVDLIAEADAAAASFAKQAEEARTRDASWRRCRG
jgi:hypothetical protein